MRILITGSSGFIGSKIVQTLNSSSFDVIKANVQNGFDILNFKEFKKIEEFDICIHLAANTFVPDSYSNPQKYFSLNINGLINCLELCRIYNAKMIFPSTYVYGIPSYLPIDESHPTKGMNPYSESKLLGEKICEVYKKYFDVESLILRPSNIYGPNQDERFLIPEILKQAKTGRVVLLDSKPKRDYLYIDDFAECILMILKSKEFISGTFNVGYGKSHSVNDIVSVINTFFDDSLNIQFKNIERESEIQDNVLDISKIKSTIKWSPSTNLHNGIRNIIEG